MSSDNLQTQRFELKFQIPESTADAVRNFVRPYLAPDEFAKDPNRPEYPVHSLYLDSPDFETYHAVLGGDCERYKLRIRYYDESPRSPVFLEIKRRIDRCIYKQRARINREAVADLLGGAWPGLHHLHPSAMKDLPAAQNFCSLMRRLEARPRARVSYLREAWTSEGHNSIRVTMDRAIGCEPEARAELGTEFENPAMPFGERVILELKFTNRFPNWMQTMVRMFDLVQVGGAKYVEGVTALGPVRFNNHGIPDYLPPMMPMHGTRGMPAVYHALVA